MEMSPYSAKREIIVVAVSVLRKQTYIAKYNDNSEVLEGRQRLKIRFPV